MISFRKQSCDLADNTTIEFLEIFDLMNGAEEKRTDKKNYYVWHFAFSIQIMIQ